MNKENHDTVDRSIANGVTKMIKHGRADKARSARPMETAERHEAIHPYVVALLTTFGGFAFPDNNSGNRDQGTPGAWVE